MKKADLYRFFNSWEFGAFGIHLTALLACLLMMVGCSTIKYVPMTSETIVVQKDSIVFVRDTVEIPIERQIIKEIIPSVDTSYISTDLARSTAYLDTLERKIHHTLEQSGTVKVRIDTFYVTKIEEKIVYQDRPVEVEVPVKYVPDFYKFCLWWFIGSIVLVGGWIALKLYIRK